MAFLIAQEILSAKIWQTPSSTGDVSAKRHGEKYFQVCPHRSTILAEFPRGDCILRKSCLQTSSLQIPHEELHQRRRAEERPESWFKGLKPHPKPSELKNCAFGGSEAHKCPEGYRCVTMADAPYFNTCITLKLWRKTFSWEH